MWRSTLNGLERTGEAKERKVDLFKKEEGRLDQWRLGSGVAKVRSEEDCWYDARREDRELDS